MRETYLYRFFGHDGSLLYVGISERLGARFKEHRREKPWHEVATIRLESFATRKEAKDAERMAIQEEHPAWNVVHNGENTAHYASVESRLDALEQQISRLLEIAETKEAERPATSLRLINSDEAAEALGKPSGDALRASYRRNPGGVPAPVRIGRRLYWDRSDVESWVSKRTEETKARAARNAEYRRRVREAGLA